MSLLETQLRLLEERVTALEAAMLEKQQADDVRQADVETNIDTVEASVEALDTRVADIEVTIEAL